MVLFDDKEVDQSFTDEEMRQALEDVKAQFPACYQWFFLWQVHKNREKNALRNQTTPREAG